MSDEQRSDEPVDRLTRMGNRLIESFLNDEELHDDDTLIVLCDDSTRGGIALHGFESDSEAMVAMYSHLRALFRVNGKDLQIHALRQG